MAKTTEEVEIQFTADHAEYIAETEKAQGATQGFMQSVGQTAANAAALGLTFLKLNSIMKTFGITQALGLSRFQAFNVTLSTLTKTIVAQIPQWVKLRAAIAATGIGAIVIALVAIIKAVKDSMTGFDGFSTTLRTFGNVIKGLTTLLIGFGEILIGIFTLDGEKIMSGFNKAWKDAAEQIKNAGINAEKMSLILKEMAEFNRSDAQARAEAEFEMAKQQRIQEDITKSVEQRVEATKAVAEQQRVILELDRQANTLAIRKLELERDTASSEGDKLRIAEELDDLYANQINFKQREWEINLAQADTIKDIYDTVVDLNQMYREQLDIITQEAVRAVQEFISQEQMAYEEHLEWYLDWLERKAEADAKAKQDEYYALLGFLEDDEEALDENFQDQIKAQKENIKLRQKQEENFENFKVNLASQGLQSLQQLAGENQQLRGAFMISEAIANTALGISRAPADYGAAAPFVIPALVALGAAQIATIAQQMNASASGSVSGDLPQVDRRDRFDVFEREGRERERRPSVVLYKEDLDRTNDRVEVLESRSSI